MAAPNKWQQIVTSLYGQRFGYNYLKQLISEGQIVAQHATDASGNITGLVGASSSLGIPLVDRTLVVFDGDSLFGKHELTYDSSTFTTSASGGVATITQAAHSISPGTVVHLGGFDDSYWNGWFTVLTSGIATGSFKFAINSAAAASPGIGAYVPNLSAVGMRMSTGFMGWAEWLTGLDFNWKNISLGSRKLSDMATEFLTNIAIVGVPGTVILGGGTNDARAAVATATSSAAMETRIQQAQGLGCQVVIVTCPPLGVSDSTTAKANAILALNAEFKRLARAYKCELWDWYELLCDPAGSGIMLPAYSDTGDDIHLKPLAHKVLAESYAIPYFVGAGYGKAIPLVANTGDTVGTLTSSNNVLAAMTGTAGTLAGGTTGQALTGWTVTNSALTSVAAGVVASSINSRQILDLVSPGSGSVAMTNTSDIKAAFTAGRKYSYSIRVNVNMPVSFRMTCDFQPVISGQTSSVRGVACVNANVPFPPGNYSMTIQSDPFGWQFPTDATLTSLRCTMVVVPTAASTGRVEFEEVTIREFTS